MDEQAKSTGIEIFEIDALPSFTPRGAIVEASSVAGNNGGLVVMKLRAGEMEVHHHDQEHVGVVLEGEFEFVIEGDVIPVKKGEIYRVLPNVPHGVRCAGPTIIVQAEC